MVLEKIFLCCVWKPSFQALRLCHQVEQSTSASSIYKEARRDRLYEALATLDRMGKSPKKEKVLNPDIPPTSGGNINRVKNEKHHQLAPIRTIVGSGTIRFPGI